jgi:hypothetical protein
MQSGKCGLEMNEGWQKLSAGNELRLERNESRKKKEA